MTEKYVLCGEGEPGAFKVEMVYQEEPGDTGLYMRLATDADDTSETYEHVPAGEQPIFAEFVDTREFLSETLGFPADSSHYLRRCHQPSAQVTTDEIRRQIAELQKQIGVDESGAIVSGHRAQSAMYLLADQLRARGAACAFCAFGLWEKHERCRHE